MKNLAQGYIPREMIAKGKTKEIWTTDDADIINARATNDITAGDGAKHDTFAGKAVFANQTTCNVFKFLQGHGIPLAFIAQYDAVSFLAKHCEMISYEIVIRRKAWGSYLKRHPLIPKGFEFADPKVEFYLKTTGKQWNGIILPVDDPLIVFEDGVAKLFRPDMPLDGQEPFMILTDYPLRGWPSERKVMEWIAEQIFIALENKWRSLDYQLVDLKIEFGKDLDGNIVVADVIDNDSWRVLTKEGEHLDKQIYRDGGNLDDVAAKYRKVMELTDKFN